MPLNKYPERFIKVRQLNDYVPFPILGETWLHTVPRDIDKTINIADSVAHAFIEMGFFDARLLRTWIDGNIEIESKNILAAIGAGKTNFDKYDVKDISGILSSKENIISHIRDILKDFFVKVLTEF